MSEVARGHMQAHIGALSNNLDIYHREYLRVLSVYEEKMQNIEKQMFRGGQQVVAMGMAREGPETLLTNYH